MKIKIHSKVGTHAIVTNINGKDYVVKFEKPDFVAEVPTEITFKDAFGKVQVYHKNYAQHLLNVYPELELVEEIPEPAVVAPKVTDKKSKVKETKNETNN